jgi:hypothetical protein
MPLPSAGASEAGNLYLKDPLYMQPAIVVIDDLQWADQASVALWGRLARSAQQVPLLPGGTMRPVPPRDDPLALRRAVGDGARPSP